MEPTVAKPNGNWLMQKLEEFQGKRLALAIMIAGPALQMADKGSKDLTIALLIAGGVYGTWVTLMDIFGKPSTP